MSDSLFDRIVSEIEDIFGPVAEVVTDPGIYSSLLQSLGLAGNDAAGGGILAVLRPLADLKNEISTIAAEGSPSFADIAHVLKSAREAFAAIEAMDSGSGAASSLGGLGKDADQVARDRAPRDSISAALRSARIADNHRAARKTPVLRRPLSRMARSAACRCYFPNCTSSAIFAVALRSGERFARRVPQ